MLTPATCLTQGWEHCGKSCYTILGQWMQLKDSLTVTDIQGFTHNPMQTVLNRPDWTYLNVSLTFVGTVREHRPGSGCKTQTDQRWTSLHVNTSQKLTVNKHNLAWKLFTRFHTHLFSRRRVITIVHEAANQWESMGSTAVRQRAPQGRINTRDDAFTGIFTGNNDAICLFQWRDEKNERMMNETQSI